MSHTHDDPRVTAYVFGELSAEQMTEFERELKASPALQQQVDGVRDAIAAIQHEFTTHGGSMSAAQLQAVEEAIHRQSKTTGEVAAPDSRDTNHESSSRAAIIAVLAASVVIAAGLTFPYWYSNSAPEISMNQPAIEFEGREFESRESDGSESLSDDFQGSEESLALPTSGRAEGEQDRRLGRKADQVSGRPSLPNASASNSSAAIDRSLKENAPFEMDEQIAATGAVAPSVTSSELQRAASRPAIRSPRSEAPNSEAPNKEANSLGEQIDSVELQVADELQANGSSRKSQSSGASSQLRGVSPDRYDKSEASDEDISDLFGGDALTPSASPSASPSPSAMPFGDAPYGDADGDDHFGRNSNLGGMPAPAKAKRTRSDAEMGMLDLGTEMDGLDMEMSMDMDMDGDMGMGGAMMSEANPSASRPSRPSLGYQTNQRDKNLSFGFAEARPGTNRPSSRGTSLQRGGVPAEEARVSRRMASPDALGLGKQSNTKLSIAPGQSEMDDMALVNPAGDRFDAIHHNPFVKVEAAPLSTFSIDVDTASYGKIRSLLRNHALPNPNAVRIEELLNYFDYDYPAPEGEHPFEASMEIAQCPWNGEHRLARVGIQAEQIDTERPASNLVFLLDVSGSMNNPDKLPLMIEGMKMLTRQLSENDRVAIVVYAGAAGLVLDSVTGDRKELIDGSLDRLHAGGSTNGGEGIKLAYNVARDHFIDGGVNRVILCSDGDFNVGVTGTNELVKIAKANAKSNIFLTVLGFGTGNHNDAMMEQVSNDANGNYAFIDSKREAKKVLVDEIGSTLVAVAKDVKIQIEFNPSQVAAYRLIGYENRVMAAEDFANDAKDGGEIGAGHTVTALYEIVPTGVAAATPQQMDDLRYQTPNGLTRKGKSDELLCLKLRYQQPEGNVSTLIEFPVVDKGKSFAQADRDFQFAAAVAGFGMLLRDSPHKGDLTFAKVKAVASESAKGDDFGYRTEFLKLIDQAQQLAGQQ